MNNFARFATLMTLGLMGLTAWTVVKTVETQDMIQVQQRVQARNLMGAGQDLSQAELPPSASPPAQTLPAVAPVAYSPPLPASAYSPTSTPVSPSPQALTPPSNYTQSIDRCDGIESDANFREFPSRNPRAILGVVSQGGMVSLTGRVVQNDGIFWHQAIAPVLLSSRQPAAQNRLDPNQTGWIASCFVTASKAPYQ